LAGARVVGVNEGADSKLGAGDTGDDFTFERKRRHRAAEALEMVGHLGFPNGKAALRVERHQVSVSGSEENSAAEHGYTAVHFGRIIRIDRLAAALILPNDAAAASVQRKDAAKHTRRVHDAIHNEWGRLERPAARGL